MITLLFHYSSISSIPFPLFPPARTGTAGYAAEKDSEWKNPYIICARNGKTAEKIIRKKLKKDIDSRVLQCYTAVVPGGQGDNPGTGTMNLKKLLDVNTRKCYNRVKKTGHEIPVSG